MQFKIILINTHLQHEKHKDQGLCITVNDITLQKKQGLEITRLAYTDPLTGLLNRRRFEQLVGKHIERA